MDRNQRLDKLFTLLKADPEDSFLQFAIAKEYEKEGKHQEALKSYYKLIHQDPDYIGSYYHVAKLLEELDQNEEAIAYYKKGIMECKKQNDMHSMAELTTALANLELDID